MMGNHDILVFSSFFFEILEIPKKPQRLNNWKINKFLRSLWIQNDFCRVIEINPCGSIREQIPKTIFATIIHPFLDPNFLRLCCCCIDHDIIVRKGLSPVEIVHTRHADSVWEVVIWGYRFHWIQAFNLWSITGSSYLVLVFEVVVLAGDEIIWGSHWLDVIGVLVSF